MICQVDNGGYVWGPAALEMRVANAWFPQTLLGDGTLDVGDAPALSCLAAPNSCVAGPQPSVGVYAMDLLVSLCGQELWGVSETGPASQDRVVTWQKPPGVGWAGLGWGRVEVSGAKLGRVSRASSSRVLIRANGQLKPIICPDFDPSDELPSTIAPLDHHRASTMWIPPSNQPPGECLTKHARRLGRE
nr:hypothetical protein CFP56_13130 [Quercus suber]